MSSDIEMSDNLNNNPLDEKVSVIQVNQVSFNYGKSQVLKSINASIPCGKIYSLLGSSGCGKTTLLRCILGRLKPSEGYIKIFGSNSGQVSRQMIGYIPQIISIIPSFTVANMLTYFGRLNEMENEKIKQRMNQLLSILHLKSEFNAKSMMLSNLSGGQLRRVALCVALFHEPRILILDEPTVGVDPLLRMQIWNHLENLCAQEGVTVLLTTHYSEEARMSDRIGYIRDGRMMVEESPAKLMNDIDSDESKVITLDEVFLRLSKQEIKDDMQSILKSHQNEKSNFKNELKMNNSSLKSQFNIKFHRICTLIWRYLIFFSRNKCSLLLWLIIPSIILFIMLFIAVRDLERLHISVYNEEHQEKHQELILEENKQNLFMNNSMNNSMNDSMNNSIVFNHEFNLPHINSMLKCLNSSCLSDRFIEILTENKRTFIVTHYSSLEEARQSIIKSKSWALIHFSSDFSNSTKTKIINGLETSDESLEAAKIRLYMDSTNSFIFNFVFDQMIRSFKVFLDGLIEENGGNIGSAPAGLEIVENIHGGDHMAYKYYSVPAIVVVTFYCSPLLMSTIMLIMERSSGLNEMILITGVSQMEIFITQIIVTLIVVMLEDVFYILLYVLMIGIPTFESIHGTIGNTTGDTIVGSVDGILVGSTGTVALMFSILLAQGLVAIMIGVLISLVCNDVSSGALLAIAIYMVLPFVNGEIWPIEAMPSFLQTVSNFLPQNLSVESMRSIIFRGNNLLDNRVAMGFISSIAWIIGCTIVSIWRNNQQ